MPWGAAVAAVGIVASSQSSKKARKAQEAADARAAAASDREMDFAEQQYDDYKELYGDLEESMVAEVEEYEAGEKREQYRGEATADTAMAFDKSQDAQRREQMRYGIDPSQARFQESEAEMGRERALAEATNLRSAEIRSEAEDDKMFARKLAVGQFGKGIAGSASAVAQANQNAGNLAVQQSGMYGKQASAASADAGKAARAFGYQMSKPSTSSYGMDGPSYGSWDTTTTDSSGYNQSDPDSAFGW